MSLLPISQEDLATCAERWGWQRTSAPSVIHRTLSGVHLLAEADDMINSDAILDRERVLMLKGLYGGVTLYGDHHVYTWQGTMSGINIPEDHLSAPNFRSWLLVQLTLALPPEVWK